MRQVLALMAIAAGGPALAAAGPCSKSMPQQDMNACISEAVGKADGVLNRAYAALSAKLDATGKHNLVAAERAWIVFRDRECELRAGYDTEHLENNGTIAPFLIGTCKLDLTKSRTADLLEQAKCPGGDLSCEP